MRTNLSSDLLSFRFAYSISHGTFTIAMIYTKSKSAVFPLGIDDNALSFVCGISITCPADDCID